jgi:hypothetical protein
MTGQIEIEYVDMPEERTLECSAPGTLVTDPTPRVVAAAMAYVTARRQFLAAYNRKEARERLDDAWSALASLFPVLPENTEGTK